MSTNNAAIINTENRKREKTMSTILRTKDLTKKYGSKVVVDNLNLEIEEGEVFGLLGPNGAGKSTTMNMICDIIKPTLGTVEFMGKDFKTFISQLRETNQNFIPSSDIYLRIWLFTGGSRHGKM